MLPIKHILFPVDFSDRTCAAAPFVAAVAGRFGAKVTLLSVAQLFPYAGIGDPGGSYIIDTDEILDELKMRLDSALVREFAHVPVERVVDVGDPARVITEFAHANKVDLIMMPTHGYGPFRSLLLGSVTAKVLHDAECPVWTAAHVEEHPVQDHLQTKAVVCAVDGSEKTVPLIRYAAQLASDFGATLRLVHAIPGVASWPTRQLDREFEDDMRLEARKKIEELQAKAGVDCPLCVAVGDVAEGVREEARRHGADLVVIGRGVIHETLGRLRTHAHEIIRRSPCPAVSM